MGVNKAVVCARRIAELDPYLPVLVTQDGLTPDTVDGFLDGLDVLVEECDSLDAKVLVRAAARARGIPVLMATSSGGLLDVERFDTDRDRPLLHGLLGDLAEMDADALAGLSAKEKVPRVLRIIDASGLPARMAASPPRGRHDADDLAAAGLRGGRRRRIGGRGGPPDRVGRTAGLRPGQGRRARTPRPGS